MGRKAVKPAVKAVVAVGAWVLPRITVAIWRRIRKGS